MTAIKGNLYAPLRASKGVAVTFTTIVLATTPFMKKRRNTLLSPD